MNDKPITLEMLQYRLQTVRREMNDGVDSYSAPITMLVDGRPVPLTAENFTVSDRGELIVRVVDVP